MGIISARAHLVQAMAAHRAAFANGYPPLDVARRVNDDIGKAIAKLPEGRCNDDRYQAASRVIARMMQRPSKRRQFDTTPAS